MDGYPDTDPEELAEAMLSVGYKEIADNYRKAAADGENDGWVGTDMVYYKFSLSLCDCLQAYVEKHKAVIFD